MYVASSLQSNRVSCVTCSKTLYVAAAAGKESGLYVTAGLRAVSNRASSLPATTLSLACALVRPGYGVLPNENTSHVSIPKLHTSHAVV